MMKSAQMMLMYNAFVASLVVTNAAARNVTVCVVQQQGYNVGSPGRETEHFNEMDKLLRSRIVDLNVTVVLDRHVIPAADFPWFSLSACGQLNPSCVGVATLAPCHHAQYMDSWASENLVPSVIVSSSTCGLTSSHSVTVVTHSQLEPALLQQLLTRLGWSQVAILVDSGSAASTSTSDLVKRLSDVYLGSLTFRLFDASMNDSSDVTLTDRMREHLQTVKESHFSNILLVASHNTAEMVLAEARNYGLLSRRYFWLVVLPDDRCSNVRNLVAGNETNVLLIQPVAPGIDPTKACYKPAKPCNANETYDQFFDALPMAVSIEALVRSSLDEETQETRMNESLDICQNRLQNSYHQTTIHNHLNKVTIPVAGGNLVTDNDTGRLSGATYSICSTEAGQPNGVTSVGRWSPEGGLELVEENGQLYRNTFRDFGYRTLRVGTQEAKPFVQKKVVDNKTTFEGFCIDILEELAQKLKFRYEFVEPEDKEWGAPADNGSGWTGVVGMVLRKEVDMGVGPVTITSIREAVIDFTKPFMEDGIGILTKRPNSDSKNMFKMFTPLTPQVWGAVAGAVVLVSVCLYGIERVSPFSASNLTGDRKLGLLGCAWLIYGSYMEQGGDPHPRSVSARCLVGFWWLFTILMTSTYTANLAAFLTVTIQDTPINSLNELATSSDLKPLVKTGSNIHTLFMEAEDGVYQDIWNKMGGMPKVTSNNESLSHVLTGSYAYMTDASQLEYIMLKDCTTYSLAKELFNTGGFGFVLQEDAPYMEVINYNIMKMHEAGLVDKWRQRWWSSPDPCTNTDRTSAAKKLDWPSLSGLFYIFLGTASVSILFRFLEFWLQGEKISRFWFRLKSMVQLAASTDNGNSPSSTMTTTTTTSPISSRSRARHYSLNGRPPLRSGVDEKDLYTPRAVEGEVGMSDMGREGERTVNGWPGSCYTISTSSIDTSSDTDGSRQVGHKKKRVSVRKNSQNSNP